MTHFVTRFREDYVYLEIIGDSNDKNDYNVKFIDLDTNNIEYQTTIKVNFWSKITNINNKNIIIKVESNDSIVFERSQKLLFNKVYINVGSKSLGDTVAWMPYTEEYRTKYNVEVVVFTHYRDLFEDVYTDIIFTDISDPNLINDVDKKFLIDYGPELYVVNNIKATKEWYNMIEKYDNVVKYFDYRKISLQRISSLILGLPNKEIVPKISIKNDNGPNIKGKYVVVAIQSTSQLKYWNHPYGWERLFEFLNRNGYKVVIIDKHKKYGVYGYFNQAPKKGKNIIDKTGNIPLNDRLIDIKYAEFMVTISSGLAWISWAIGTHVVMISGFTKPWYEFESNITRIHNSNVCNGCWNDENIDFNYSSWVFCPRKKDFICSMSIQPKDVINEIKPMLK